MKKIIIQLLFGLGVMALLNSCSKKLELSPVSSISDGNYWKTPDQFDAFVSGIHARFRSHNSSFQALGELRSDIFGTEPGNASTFSGEATQGLERLWLQTLNLDNPGVSNFGGFYSNIVQLNLLIDKLNTTDIVTPANKAYYLGIAYGMRAYYYFHLLRTWGDVVIQTDPVTAVDISNLAKAASPVTEVMALIKSDIDKSVTSFGSNYTFRNTKSYWSKPASLMLKAEVFLWTANRTGGTADANTALAALTDIQTNTAGLALLSSYPSVFSSANKGNNEIIFSIRYLLNEATMGYVSSSFTPQTGLIANFYDSAGNRQFNVTTDNWGGLLRAPVRVATFRQFDDKDSRKWASIQPAYTRPSPGVYVIAGCFTNKFQGEQNAGSRQYTNDYPVYRYADLLLMIAEAKIILGQSPATEINLVRARAYGANYNATLHAFPNQVGDTDAKQALLRERLFEFVFEGKRWYDLRRLGDSYVFAYTTVLASESYKLLWPIDRNSLTNNRSLVQTPGYPAF
jgi:starch-binding outer membrane protein, SusD/RagB family